MWVMKRNGGWKNNHKTWSVFYRTKMQVSTRLILLADKNVGIGEKCHEETSDLEPGTWAIGNHALSQNFG